MEDQYAFPAGVTLAMAAATFGLVSGGLIGGPIATLLIRRNRPVHATPSADIELDARTLEHASLEDEIDQEPAGEAPTAYRLLQVITVILVAMWLGSLLSRWLGQYVTLPAYIGAMLVPP